MPPDMFSDVSTIDYWLIAEGAGRTILMTLSAGLFATMLGVLLGCAKMTDRRAVRVTIDTFTDTMRCVPLLVQVTIIYAGLNLLNIPVSIFGAGTLALGLFAAGYISETVREAFQAVPVNLRKAARGLGMTRAQEYRYVVVPLGIRQGFPSWLGILLGIVKDTSVVAVIGYVELLRATQIVITRSQDPMPLLATAAVFYFIICFPLSMLGRHLEGYLNRGSTI